MLVRCSRVRGKTIESTVTIDITVEIVIVVNHVELHVGGPVAHDLELPFSVRVVSHNAVDSRIITLGVEQITSKELRDTARQVIIVVGMSDHRRGLDARSQPKDLHDTTLGFRIHSPFNT